MDEEPPERKRKSKRERFLTVAERRTLKILKGVRLLAKCSNKASYAYSENDVKKVFLAIQEELDRAKLAFSRDAEIKFSLDKEEGVDDVKPHGK